MGKFIGIDSVPLTLGAVMEGRRTRSSSKTVKEEELTPSIVF
jgi:hypothetical protein